jgi:hypothetical protein
MDGSKDHPLMTAGLDSGDKYSYLCLIDQHGTTHQRLIAPKPWSTPLVYSEGAALALPVTLFTQPVRLKEERARSEAVGARYHRADIRHIDADRRSGKGRSLVGLTLPLTPIQPRAWRASMKISATLASPRAAGGRR